MTPFLRRLAVLTLIALTVILGACSDDTSVGSEVDEQGGGAGGNLAIGDETTTTAAPATTVTAPPQTTAKPVVTAPPTTARPTTTTTAQPTFKITINADQNAEGQFVPNNAAVRAGTIVEFVNADTVPRSVVAQNGAFRSPDIPPGSSFKWKAVAGSYNYQDGTRPYAVGALKVQ